ncbi:beta strand repeat-containing protein [Zhongshania aliphaticivorans]|uniref:beta strand repeat-containing protein n=1 Tax=Zhongshania aliphaticivorans TaxID=1470434 RepID=UPI0012E44639|nr:Ig-like domain-containing protein [Zhongshania aliphaticivorans]CAA0091060.1 Uncharacterised protein [Zhongshania aliphaticivorans]
MKKQEMQERVTVDVDTTAVDTLSAELAAAVAPQSDLNQAPAEELFDNEKKLDEELELSEGQIQAEAVQVASTDAAAAAMVVDTAAATSGIGGGAASADGGVSPLVWAGGALLTAGAIVVATDDDDSDGPKSTPTPVNTAPTADATKAVTVDQNSGAKVISIIASDAEQSPGELSYAIVSDPSQGTVVQNAGTNQFTYTPTAGLSGADSFVVQISDGKGGVTTQTVNITIEPTPGTDPGTVELTAGTDIATADTFIAPMVFTPDGSDRILSLQDEDILTGTAGKTDNTLNATMGNINADEGTTGVVTPELHNIQNINIDWTGTTRTLDLRNSDSTARVNIERITQDAGTAGAPITVDNISTPVSDLRVHNSASDDANVIFTYKQGVLDGDDTLALELDDVLANGVVQNARGSGAATEGFETVNLNAINGVDLNAFAINEMESLVITGSDNLKVLNLVANAGAFEFNAILGGAIGNPSAVGLLNLDASAFTGDTMLDITTAVGGFNDPQNSGARVHTDVKGGSGDDAFYTTAAIAATTTGTTTVRDLIDGGAGSNKIVTTSNIAANVQGEAAAISNVQGLELRQQAGAAQTVDFDAFDSSLTSVLMRGEQGAGAVFNLFDLGATLAESGGLQLNHGISGAAAPTVNVLLKDASGASDTVAITLEDDLNIPNPDARGNNVFNFTLNIDGDNANGDTIKNDGKVENVTIIDNDVETNTVTLGKVSEHTGTLTLSGGEAGDEFTVAGNLISSVIDASAQASDLRLSVGTANQDIRLGTGDDLLTFNAIDQFTAADSISDAGGNDTVRAAFSQDGNLALTNIENLHIIANQNVTLGMANADVDNLVILADIAADGSVDNSPVTAEPFGLGVPGVATTDIITLNDTSLSVLNFSADLDTDDDNTAANRVLAEAAAVTADPTWSGIGSTAAGDAAYKTVISDEPTVANFNGVTLANNTAGPLTVNINSALDDVIYGATAYNVGQLTAHGVTSMDINITDEDVTAGAANAVTTINNIFAKNMASLTVAAADDVVLGTVSGSPLNNSLSNFDSTNVGGDLTAQVISLGDNATVALGAGDNVFSALGSAGKDVVITAGNGMNTITGTAQDDTITTGSGWDIVMGDRGDNVITSGAGDDTLTAKDGNDIFDVGSGFNTVTDNLGTGIDATLATNTVSINNGFAQVLIDTDGVGGAFVDQMLAVGNGSDLTVSWTGATLLDNSAVLDGSLATVAASAGPATLTGDANANLFILDGVGTTLNSTSLPGATAGVITVNGGAGNDVVIWTGSAAGDGLVFNGGAGNDAAVGSIDNDIFTGGAGADKYVMQDVAAEAAGFERIDTVIIADGESTASAWDVVVGFNADFASALGTLAGSGTLGGDVLDLSSTLISAAAANVNGTNAGAVQSHTIDVNGLVTFDTNDTNAFSAVVVGTGAGQISLTDALSYLAANLNSTNETVAFQYDANGNGLGAEDSTFVFQDGAADTVVELVGLYNGVEALGAGTAGLVEIG